MKQNLGKYILIFLLSWHVEIFASSYSWETYVDKTDVVVNEAVYVRYVCSFNDKAQLYNIDFNPIGRYEKYDVKLLSEDQKLVDEKRINSYEFIVFAKEAGKLELSFDIKMKKTTQESINNTVLGRDNVENEEFILEKVEHKKIIINVKNIKADLVGEIKVKLLKNEQKLKAYEPFHMKIELEGYGNLEYIQETNLDINSTKIFSQKQIENITLTKDGYSGKIIQTFAIVSQNDFVVPELNFSYYDTKTKELKNIKFESFKVEIVGGYKKEQLLDVEDETKEFDYSVVYYALVFLAGFLSAKIKYNFTKRKREEKDDLVTKINNVRSVNELMIILTLSNNKVFLKLILSLENKEVTSLKKAKELASKLISN